MLTVQINGVMRKDVIFASLVANYNASTQCGIVCVHAQGQFYWKYILGMLKRYF
jgi:hypothetical protein